MTVYNTFPPNFISARRIVDQFNNLQDKLANTNKFPLYDIERFGEYYYEIRLALAGFSREDINVQYDNSVLTIKGEQKPREPRKDAVLMHKNISFGKFERSFALDENTVIDKVTYVDGILTVSFHIAQPEKKPSIKIEIS